tara:strand:- start:4612 stop:4974 length:363 start_codon:yes stop_codon:yes gene_type:complete
MNKTVEIKIKNKNNTNLFINSFKNDNMIFLVWADWCHYSKVFKPEWIKFKKNNNGKSNKFKIFELKDNYKNKLNENPVFSEVFTNFRGFPTIFIINKNGKINILPENNISNLNKAVNKFK